MTRTSLVNFENLVVMSSTEVATATNDVLTSKSSVTGLKSRDGHVDESSVSHVGPCHHRLAVDNDAGSVPLEMRSAGLKTDGTCRQFALDVASWMKATRFPTNVFQRVEKSWIQVSTIDESVHMYDS